MKRLKLLYEIIQKRKTSFLIAVAILLCSIFLRTTEPKVIQVLIDYVLKSNEASTDVFVQFFVNIINRFSEWSVSNKILLLSLIYVFIAGCRSLFILVSRSISYGAAEKSMQEFRVRVFEHIQKIPVSSFNVLNKGELIQRMTGDMDTLRNFINNHVVELIRLGALFFFSAFMLFQINTTYALVSMILCPFIFLSTYFFFRYESKVWREHEDEADKLTNLAQENLNGIRTVKAYSKMLDEIAKFEQQNLRKYKAGMKNIKLHTFFWPVNDLLMYSQTILFIILGGVFVLEGKLTLGALVSAYTYNTMLSFPLRQAGRILSQMSMAFVAIDRIQDILSVQRESNEGIAVQDLCGDIEFNDVCFTYTDGEKNILNHIHFKVEQGEKIAIMGSSAAGKTTLVKLLLRLYEPIQGKIYIDDKPIAEYNLSSYRNRIGFAMQQSVLFSMSLSENLMYANQHSSIDEQSYVLNLAGFGDVGTVLPKGIDTAIGERGVSLSGGQKQRLALARTLIKENDILILDDITSALDKNTEKKVLDNVLNLHKNKTMFIVTHRISTLSKVDKVLVLNSRGEMEDFGTPHELIHKNKYLVELNKIEKNNIEVLASSM